MKKPNPNKKAISPIIATLLLILIAIAAGVVVYAYVIGFVGNSTSNSGATTNTLSIDQLSLKGTSPTAMPVTVYVRNEGPSAETFNTGFYLKGTSVNDLLGPAISLSISGGGTITALAQTGTTAVLMGSGTNTISIAITVTCTTSDTLTITGFGTTATSVTGTCTTGTAVPFTGTITLPTGFVVSSTFAATPSSFTVIGTPSTVILGTSVSAGTISEPLNSVASFTLAVSGVQTSNPMTTGQTYSFQITGTDGGSTTLSGKAS